MTTEHLKLKKKEVKNQTKQQQQQQQQQQQTKTKKHNRKGVGRGGGGQENAHITYYSSRAPESSVVRHFVEITKHFCSTTGNQHFAPFVSQISRSLGVSLTTRTKGKFEVSARAPRIFKVDCHVEGTLFGACA